MSPSPPLFLSFLFYLTPLLGGVLSFLSSRGADPQWRHTLRKSRLSPPFYIFGPVWTILYLFMGHASLRIYLLSIPTTMLSPPLIAYLAMCLFNHFYIIVLFGLQRIDLALVTIIPVFLSAALVTILFIEQDLIAGYLMAAVLLWLSFNVYLNVYLCVNNPVYTEADLRRVNTKPIIKVE